VPPLGRPIGGIRETVLVQGNPEANARQDGEAIAAIAYCEFQHGITLHSWFLVWWIGRINARKEQIPIKWDFPRVETLIF
jgi:hypothetical protein